MAATNRFSQVTIPSEALQSVNVCTNLFFDLFAGPTAALPQIAPMEPIKTPFPRAQRRSLESGSPAQRSAATQLGRRAQQHRAHHSGKDQSRFPLEGSSLSERDPALAQTLRGFRAARIRV